MVQRQNQRPPVVYDVPAAAIPPEVGLQMGPAVDMDEEKLKARAARFCTEYTPVQVVPAARPSAKSKAVKPVFSSGLDLLSQDEIEKRQKRAAKFGTPLVNNGLQPALTAKEDTKASVPVQNAVDLLQDATPVASELSEAELADQIEQRRQSAMTAERRPDTVHLHGVDLMTASDCLQFFAEYGNSALEWLNDTSCNVMFEDADSANRAILGLGTLAPPEEAPDGFGLTVADVSDVTHLWHAGQGFAKGAVDNYPVPLLFRLATVADVRQLPSSKQRNKQMQGNRQAGGRGKKAHRGKGKGRGGRGQQPQQPQKRQYEDMDGDVEMKTRGQRGGKKYQQRKRLAMGCNDVEMQEAFDGEYHPTNGELRQAAANGEVSMTAIHGPSTLFSASAAGAAVVPTFQQYAPVPSQDLRPTQLLDYGDV